MEMFWPWEKEALKALVFRVLSTAELLKKGSVQEMLLNNVYTET